MTSKLTKKSKDTQLLILSFFLFGIVYVVFDQLKFIRFLAVTAIICSFNLWNYYQHKSNPKKAKIALKESVVLGILALALFFFLIYYD